MRRLIAFYLFLGLLLLTPAVMALATFSGAAALRLVGWNAALPGATFAEGAVVCTLVGLLPLLAFAGLWWRSQLARLVLLAVSLLTFVVTPIGVFLATATLLGMKRSGGRPLDDSPFVSLAIALGCALFAAWQYRVLTSARARREFSVSKTPPGGLIPTSRRTG
jgi:hypothetical protein